MSDGFGDWVALFIGRHLPASFTWNFRACVSLSNCPFGEGLPAIRVTFRDDADLGNSAGEGRAAELDTSLESVAQSLC